MATKIKMPGVTLSDPGDLPVMRADSILPAAGALMLVDPTHPVTGWAAGVPADAATVPNVAWEQAAAAIGSGDETTLAAQIANVGLSATQGLVERTTKGGLHAVISPTFSFSDATVGFNVALPQAIYDYCRTNDTHKYYVSLWHRVTRAATLDGLHKLFVGLNADTTFMAAFSQTANLVAPGTLDTASTIDDTVGGNRFRNLATTPGDSFGADATVNNTNQPPGGRSIFLVGNRHTTNGVSSGGARRGKGGSRILYRAYLEDLTASGRTYAEVNALDLALYTQVCNTAGGRYYGDSFTNPTTVP